MTTARIATAHLTSTLLAERPSIALSAEERQGLLAVLAQTGATGPDLLRVDGFTLTAGFDATTAPFSWSPRLAKRTLGLAALRACVHGTAKNPMEACEAVVAEAIARATGGAERSGSLGSWLASAPKPVRTLAIAYASSYATELWSALDWSAMAELPTIGARDDTVVHRPAGLLLKGRAEVIVHHGNQRAFSPRLLVLGGTPQPEDLLTLGAAALTAALADRDGHVPSVMVGWHPAAGQAVVLPVDHIVLRRAAAGITRQVATWRSSVSEGPVTVAA
jgi:hypothetical protein